MDRRFKIVAGFAAEHHSALSTGQLERLRVTATMRANWVDRGLLAKAGLRSYVIGGSQPTWHRALAVAVADTGGRGYVAGRSLARMYNLDGFTDDAVELLVPWAHRMASAHGVVHSTRRPIGAADLRWRDGLRCVTPERMILDSPTFGFSQDEIENAIDSAIRLRLVSETRLRRRVEERHSRGVNGGRALLDAMIDTGGESALERRFLALVRHARLPRPTTQRVYRSNGTTIARADFQFADGLIVEVHGHEKHSARQHRRRDAERANEMAVRSRRALTFTFEHVTRDRDYVVAMLRRAQRSAAA
jgi:very-short-patch-repair endonuclease